MALTTLQVQRQVERLDEDLLKLPGPLMSHPADKGVLRHPVREPYLTICERQPRAATHTTQLDPELLGKQTAEREPREGSGTQRRWGRRGAAKLRSLTVNHGAQRTVSTAAQQPYRP
jgi:hypothetical protein